MDEFLKNYHPRNEKTAEQIQRMKTIYKDYLRYKVDTEERRHTLLDRLAPSSTTKENARESVEVTDEILDKLFRVKQYLDDAKLSIVRGHGNVESSLDKADQRMKQVVDQSLKMTLTKRSSGKLTRKRGRKRKSNGSMWKKLFR
jgi:hypothetical protein